jgi:hypothetical protein
MNQKGRHDSRKINTKNKKSRKLVTFSKKWGVENKVIKIRKVNEKLNRQKTEIKLR